jgi:triosephosphate isomerase
VNPENAVPLIAQKNIDGLFIGRSAWDAERFNQIIRSVLPVYKAKRSDTSC